MNLRDFQLSSRSVIPLALAIPIAREPVDLRVQEERMRKERQRRTQDDPSHPVVSFYL